MSHGKTYVLILILVFNQYSEGGKIVRRFNYDARLYEHFAFNSRYIQYSRTSPGEWENIPKMAEARNYSYVSMICTLGPGAWIFYPAPDNELGNEQLYYLVIGEHCVRADDIESVQPLGKPDEALEQGVILFLSPHFTAGQELVTEERTMLAKSLIFTGSQSYSIESNGQKICLRPGISLFDEGYCLLPDLKSAFNMEGEITVKENCTDDEDEKKMVVQNCYLNGVHEIFVEKDFKLENVNEICTGAPEDPLMKKFSFVLEMWKKRKNYQLKDFPEPIQDENKIKLKVLWSTLQLFSDTCVNYVNEDYVYILGQIFVTHLAHLWNNSTEYTGSRTTEEVWKMADDFLDVCELHKPNLNIVTGFCGDRNNKDLFPRMVQPSANGFSEGDHSWNQIVNGETFDPVIEQVWLIINYVLATCSQMASYVNNDWNDMLLLYHQNFLDPLQELWADPGDWKAVYSAVFHGYEMRKAHRDILTCLRKALEGTPNYDPIGRPRNFRKFMAYKYALPEHGKIDQDELLRAKRKAAGHAKLGKHRGDATLGSKFPGLHFHG